MDLSIVVFDLRDAIQELREERAEMLKRIETLAARVDEAFRKQQPAQANPLEDLAEAEEREAVQKDEQPKIDNLDLKDGFYVASALKEHQNLIGNPKQDIKSKDRSEEVLQPHSGILPEGESR